MQFIVGQAQGLQAVPSSRLRLNGSSSPQDFEFQSHVEAERDDIARAPLAALEGRFVDLENAIATLRSRHAALSDEGKRLVHHLGARIAMIELVISGLRAALSRQAADATEDFATKSSELATLVANLRQLRGFSDMTETELSSILAHLSGAQISAQALLAMIERIIAALQAEFASFRG